MNDIPARWRLRFPDLYDRAETGPWPRAGLGYNMSPGQRLPVLKLGDPQYTAGPTDALWTPGYHWGVVVQVQGRWRRVINAKLHRLMESRLWRPAYERGRRCIVAANGYYEWQKRKGGPSQPYYVHRRDGRLLALAGLYGRAPITPGGERQDVFVVVTRDPTGGLEQIHNRMPVELPDDLLDAWVNPDSGISLQAVSAYDPAPEWEWWPVSTRVNNPRNDGPELIERLE